MERSEPVLVPEWLKGIGPVNGSGNSAQLVVSSLKSADDSSFSTRNIYSRGSSDKAIPHPPFLDRSSSSNSRQISGGNNFIKHPYSSFARNPRDRNHERDKHRSSTEELWDRDSSNLLPNILTNSVDKNSLRRSQSLVPRRFGGGRPEDLSNGTSGDLYTGINTVSQGSSLREIQKDSIKNDLSSLGAEEKQMESGMRKSLSPFWCPAVQNLPIRNSGLSGGENWTSALADVPETLGSNTIVNSSTQQGPVATGSTGATNSVVGLNMAEALSKVPSHLRSTPVPDKSQRLEELAIKQSRQLIPMTPSITKGLAPSSLDKLKRPKVVVKANDSTVARSIQQQQHSTQLANQSRGGPIKSDILNASQNGKFLVLKPGREIGASLTKDGSSPTNSINNKIAIGQLQPATHSQTALTGYSNSKVPIVEKKAAASTLNARLAEKKSSSQAQSRSDFFNLMRKKKTSMHSSSVSGVSGAIISLSGKANENTEEANVATVSTQVVENHIHILANGDTDYKGNTEKESSAGELNVCPNGSFCPDEEEAAFLRSLGWEENGEDEGLTEEEIKAFYEDVKVRPSLNVGGGIHRDCSVLSRSHSSN